MKIFLGSDHRGFELKNAVAQFLTTLSIEIIDCGPQDFDAEDDFNDYAKKVAEATKDAKSMDSQFAAFSGTDRIYKDEIFTGSNIAAIFGGAKLDLRHAKFDKDTVIKAFALFGGIDISVPNDIKIKLKSGFIFGGFSDDRKNPSDKSKYTIYIDAAGGFGGITITDKPEK